ncbi:hypothetical protein COOONC_12673 [Cooperia oncophora]
MIASIRDIGFTHSVPSSLKMDDSTTLPNPFPEDTYETKPNLNDDDSLYAPLRRQPMVLREYLLRPRTDTEKQEIRTIVDEIAVKIFKTEFTKCTLAKEAPSITTGSSSSSTSRVSAGDQRSKWHSYFPCAKGYMQSTSSGLRMLFASRKGALDAFEVAKPAMSHTFAKLLHCFSKIIGLFVV